MIYIKKIDSVEFDVYANFSRMLEEVGFDGSKGHLINHEYHIIIIDGIEYKYAESLEKLLEL